jgi:hypothetical protein
MTGRWVLDRGVKTIRNDPFPRESRIRGGKGGFETDARFFRRDDPSTRFPSADAPSHDRFSGMR